MDKHELLIRFDELRQHRCFQTGYFLISLLILAIGIGGQFYLMHTGIMSQFLNITLPIMQLFGIIATAHFLVECLFSWAGHHAFCEEHKGIKEYWEATRSRKPGIFERLF